jgi:pimeloyl-ACP methyl ester carboxylesterase
MRNIDSNIKKNLLVVAVFAVVMISVKFFTDKEVGEGMYLNISENIVINGVEQFVSIRAQKSDTPLLLYLHGGPGDAALPLVLKYNKELENYFTVVVWEQRGAGKSYYKFGENEGITIDTYVEDTYQLAQILLERFDQDKLYLVGHSWGSVIGINFIKLHPELVGAYIGCGQVVNMEKSSQLSYEYALQKNEEQSNDKIVKKIKSIDYSYIDETWFDDLLYVTKQVVKNEGSLYGKTNYNNLIWEFLISNQYSLVDLIHRQKGATQSIKSLWPELMTTNFEDDRAFDVPVIFIEGENDFHVSSIMVEEYFETITSEKEFYWFEKSGHFPQWSEADRFNSIVINLLTD